MTSLVDYSLTYYQLRQPALAALRSGVAAVIALARVWLTRIRERRELAALTEHELRDIGVTPADVFWETEKPFWRD